MIHEIHLLLTTKSKEGTCHALHSFSLSQVLQQTMKLLALLVTLLLQNNQIVSFSFSSRYQSHVGRNIELNAVTPKQNNDNGVVDRKAFVKNLASLSAFLMVQASWADEDLSMPTPEEQKAIEVRNILAS